MSERGHPPVNVLAFWRDVLAPSVPLLQRDTWAAWKTALRALYALPMSDADLDLYRRCTGLTDPPHDSSPVRPVWSRYASEPTPLNYLPRSAVSSST